ncbi:MAG TPA: proton-conducting transporter membrane subunit, partial [Isosphaeraceae bacterium]|nr:proton-conducting transporter membrane subunit [Isosphaeraceae bacterium]
VYAAGMATIQRETRRFYAHLFLSHASLVLVGLEFHTELSLTSSLSLWFSVILSLGGFGLTLRAVEARFGRLSLSDHHGLYEHSPTLAVCFLLTGLASVGFPGTIGFISTELLVDSAVGANPYAGIAVIAAAALNGIAVMRAYFLLFTGARHVSTVSLGIGLRERIAVLALSVLILIGGLIPQPGVSSRYDAAKAILRDRTKRLSRATNQSQRIDFPHRDQRSRMFLRTRVGRRGRKTRFVTRVLEFCRAHPFPLGFVRIPWSSLRLTLEHQPPAPPRPHHACGIGLEPG